MVLMQSLLQVRSRGFTTAVDKTLLKGLEVLTHVTRSDHNVRITDVAAALKLTKSNAYRILRTLEAAGFLRQEFETKAFKPTLMLWELGMNAVSRVDLRERAAEALRQLAVKSRETVHLAVLDGLHVIYIEKIDSSEPVLSYTRLGGRAPAYCVATGKAMLSHMADAALDKLLVNLEKHSRFTLTNPKLLRAELVKARELGYAINRGEWRETVWGLASVIKDATGSVAAAVGVSGPSFRLEDEHRCAKLASFVKSAARQITESISFGGGA